MLRKYEDIRRSFLNFRMATYELCNLLNNVFNTVDVFNSISEKTIRQDDVSLMVLKRTCQA